MILALFLFDFVAAKALLGLGKLNVLLENRIVFAQGELIWGVHCILFGVILTNTGFLGNEADKLAFGIILFCHIGKYIITYYFRLEFLWFMTELCWAIVFFEVEKKRSS